MIYVTVGLALGWLATICWLRVAICEHRAVVRENQNMRYELTQQWYDTINKRESIIHHLNSFWLN